MTKKSNTKSKIVSAAWKLFYDQGYDSTTVDEIIRESGTSRGSFYHYFDGKDALVGSLAYLLTKNTKLLFPKLILRAIALNCFCTLTLNFLK